MQYLLALAVDVRMVAQAVRKKRAARARASNDDGGGWVAGRVVLDLGHFAPFKLFSFASTLVPPLFSALVPPLFSAHDRIVHSQGV